MTILSVNPATGDVSINRKAVFADTFFEINGSYDFRVFAINEVGESLQAAQLPGQVMSLNIDENLNLKGDLPFDTYSDDDTSEN